LLCYFFDERKQIISVIEKSGEKKDDIEIPIDGFESRVVLNETKTQVDKIL
jgi:hypothetical protein